MDDGREVQMDCRSCRARMEDYLSDYSMGGLEHIDPESGLAAHLRDCAACREAFDEASLASTIVRGACEPAAEVSGAFVTRVMAGIREEDAWRIADGTIWRPIELLASRFALAASVVLLAAVGVSGGICAAIRGACNNIADGDCGPDAGASGAAVQSG